MANPLVVRPLIGWPLLAVPDDAGELHFPTLEQSVRQSLQILLLTRPGEQLMRPEFGAGLENFLHEPNTLGTRRRIRDAIAQAIGGGNRIIVDRIEVQESEEDPTLLRVETAYACGGPEQRNNSD